MNKLFSKIAALIAGLSLVIGVGFAVATNRAVPNRADGDTYKLVKDVNDIASDDRIIIGNGTSGTVKFLSTTQNENNRGATSGIAIADEMVTLPNDAEVITLGRSDNKWTLYANGSTSGYLYAASSSKNYLRTRGSDSDGNSRWTISITNAGVASITATGSNSRNQLKNNGSLFACYSSGQTPVAIYKLQATKTLSSIAVETAPTKTIYAKGETFDPTGLVIRRNYDDESHDTFTYANHTDSFSFSPSLLTPLQTSDVSVAITYNEKTTSQAILVREITAVELAGDMTNKNYVNGDDWDLTGLYLSITWNAGEPNPSMVNLSDLTKNTDYLLDHDTAVKGLTSLTIIGEYKGFDFSKTITGIIVVEKPIEDVLTTDNTSLGAPASGYGDLSNIAKTGHSDIVSEATYAGHFMKGTGSNLNAIQINPSQSSYICTTASSQYLKTIGVKFKNSAREIKFFGSNTAYTATYNSDGSASSTLLGSLSANGSFEVEGNYKYLYIVPTATTYVESFTITWKLAKEEIASTLTTGAVMGYSTYTDNGDSTFSYTNLAIRFSGLASEELWTRLNNESTITGYGMLLSTDNYLGANELKSYYETADGTNVKKFTNADTYPDHELKAEPTLKDGNYVWNLFKAVAMADATKDYVAVAFIEIDGGVVFFRQTKTSVRTLAQQMIAGPNYDEGSLNGSLNYLANL